MRKVVLGLQVLVAVAAVAGLSFVLYRTLSSPEDGRLVLLRAIQAHGGEASIQRSHIGWFKARGQKHSFHGRVTPFIWEETFHLPHHLKRVIHEQDPDRTLTFLYRSGKCYAYRDDEPGPHVSDTAGARVECFLGCLGQLADLRKDGVSLRTLGPAVVDGRPAVGIEAQMGSEETLQLYFHKDTALLLKLSRVFSQAQGSASKHELICADYRDWDGVPLPTRLRYYKDDALHYAMTIYQVKFVDHIEASVFEKP